MANKYLMAVYHFFSGYENFEIEAENKEDAVKKGKEFVKHNFHYRHGGNYNTDDVKCIKKMKSKKGKK